MKVLIVDDEKHVREAIRYFVPWDKYNISAIYEATNGQEATLIMQEHQPNIVFTDMRMPLMDGAELLEWLHAHYPNTKTIVISGYQDFNYVKPAIVYGGTDYLLKPLNSKQLIASAEHAFKLWLEEEAGRRQSQQQSMQLNVLRPLYWDKVLSDLVYGRSSFQEHQLALCEELGMPIAAAECRVGVISLQGTDCRLLQRFHGDVALTAFVLANVCNEVMAPEQSGYAFRSLQGEGELVVLLWNAAAQAEAVLAAMNEAIRQAYGVQVDIGLSRPNPLPEGLQQAYTQAREGLEERNLLQREGRIHSWRALPGGSRPAEDHALDVRLEKLRIAVLSGDDERMQRVVEEWAGQLAGLPLLTESSFLHQQEEILAVLRRWRPEEEIHLGLCYDAEGLFSVEHWQSQLKSLLQRLSSGTGQAQGSRLVLEIREYLNQNYAQDMTLQHIAERFFISRENVSRKFKQITGENLSDYLTNLRVEKAKMLLQNTNLRLSQISELVGYEDEKYFSRVFKKSTGVTPREYRKHEEK
ncbi:response regulator [Paenibacillus sp. MMS20-IR301]|uniref:response regulator n=1 Tax=Paenibacillus sp. MMS20-IR301 TaxID=2895946 RepID=UPI0028E3B0B0|nr:response regulator [Paenibacillus sp. MMS20-IR301]WNS42924.1 response regulator [Paenibacillus sp. MMS20-IR301]